MAATGELRKLGSFKLDDVPEFYEDDHDADLESSLTSPAVAASSAVPGNPTDTNRSQIKPLDQNNAASPGVARKSSGSHPPTAANLLEAAAAVDQPTLSSNLGNLNRSNHGVLKPSFLDMQPQDVKRTKGIQDQDVASAADRSANVDFVMGTATPAVPPSKPSHVPAAERTSRPGEGKGLGLAALVQDSSPATIRHYHAYRPAKGKEADVTGSSHRDQQQDADNFLQSNQQGDHADQHGPTATGSVGGDPGALALDCHQAGNPQKSSGLGWLFGWGGTSSSMDSETLQAEKPSAVSDQTAAVLFNDVQQHQQPKGYVQQQQQQDSQQEQLHGGATLMSLLDNQQSTDQVDVTLAGLDDGTNRASEGVLQQVPAAVPAAAEAGDSAAVGTNASVASAAGRVVLGGGTLAAAAAPSLLPGSSSGDVGAFTAEGADAAQALIHDDEGTSRLRLPAKRASAPAPANSSHTFMAGSDGNVSGLHRVSGGSSSAALPVTPPTTPACLSRAGSVRGHTLPDLSITNSGGIASAGDFSIGASRSASGSLVSQGSSIGYCEVKAASSCSWLAPTPANTPADARSGAATPAKSITGGSGNSGSLPAVAMAAGVAGAAGGGAALLLNSKSFNRRITALAAEEELDAEEQQQQLAEDAQAWPAAGDLSRAGVGRPDQVGKCRVEEGQLAGQAGSGGTRTVMFADDALEGTWAAADEASSGSVAGGRVPSARLTRIRPPHQLTEIPEDAPVAPPLALDEVEDDGLAACADNDGHIDGAAVGLGREVSAGGNNGAAIGNGSGTMAVTLGAAACAAAAVGGVVTAAKSPSSCPPVTHHHQHVGGVCLLDGVEQYNSTGVTEAAVILPGSTVMGTADLAAGGEVFDDVASVSSVSSSASRHYLEPVPLDEFALRSLRREGSSASSKHTPVGMPGLSRRSAPGLGSRSSSSGSLKDDAATGHYGRSHQQSHSGPLHSMPPAATVGIAGAGILTAAGVADALDEQPHDQQQQQQQLGALHLNHRMSTGSTDDDLPAPKLPTEVVAAAFAAAAAPTPPTTKGPVSKLQQPASMQAAGVYDIDSSMADEAAASPSSCWAQQLGSANGNATPPASVADSLAAAQESASKSISSKPPAYAAEVGCDAADGVIGGPGRQAESTVVAFAEYELGSGGQHCQASPSPAVTPAAEAVVLGEVTPHEDVKQHPASLSGAGAVAVAGGVAAVTGVGLAAAAAAPQAKERSGSSEQRDSNSLVLEPLEPDTAVGLDKKQLLQQKLLEEQPLDVAAGAPAVDPQLAGHGPVVAPDAAPAAATRVDKAMKMQLQQDHFPEASPTSNSRSRSDDRASQQQQQRKAKAKWWMCGCIAAQE
eukprot:gene2722-3019_t